MFPIKNFWSHVGIVFTFSYEYFSDEQFEKIKENKNNNYMKDFREAIQSYIKEIKNLYGYKIDKPENFNSFFTNNNKNNNNDTEETLNDVFKKIVKAEYNASKITKKIKLFNKKEIKTQSINEQLDKSKSLNNIKNKLKNKTFMNNSHKFSKYFISSL